MHYDSLPFGCKSNFSFAASAFAKTFTIVHVLEYSIVRALIKTKSCDRLLWRQVSQAMKCLATKGNGIVSDGQPCEQSSFRRGGAPEHVARATSLERIVMKLKALSKCWTATDTSMAAGSSYAHLEAPVTSNGILVTGFNFNGRVRRILFQESIMWSHPSLFSIGLVLVVFFWS